MRALRLLLAGFVALTVLVAGLLAAALIVLTGLVGYVVQGVKRGLGLAQPGRAQVPNRPSSMRMDDVIDI